MRSITSWVSEIPLSEILHYNDTNGFLYWKERPYSMFRTPKDAKSWNSRQSGNIALSKIDKDGYRALTVFGRSYRQHRLIWMMHNNGSCPEFIDHINGKKDDNRIVNLRAATKTENGWNRGKNKNNTTGYKGVYLMKKNGLHRASVSHGGKVLHAGFHSTAEEAHNAYCMKLKEVSSEFFHP